MDEGIIPRVDWRWRAVILRNRVSLVSFDFNGLTIPQSDRPLAILFYVRIPLQHYKTNAFLSIITTVLTSLTSNTLSFS
jgi:hypothetical protein